MNKRINVSAYRREFNNMTSNHAFDYFVTLATNWSDVVSATNGGQLEKRAERFWKNVSNWEARVNRALVGPKWVKSPKRFGALVVVEHVSSNIHAHLLMRERTGAREEDVELAISSAWAKVVPRGTINFQEIRNISDISTYITKEAHLPEWIEHYDIIGKLDRR